MENGDACCKVTQLLGLTAAALAEVNAQISALPKDTAAAIAALPPLRKLGRYSSASTSWLQEAFVRLHRILFMQRLLPLSHFGEFRHPRFGNMFDKVAISRRAFVIYNRKNAFRVPAHAQCLGWDTKTHISQIRGCSASKMWLLKFKDEGNQGAGHGPPRLARVEPNERKVFGDLTLPRLGLTSTEFSQLPSYDLVVCNQVVEHVKEPFAAVRALFELVKPGGLVFWTAPFLERNHFPRADFFRYTADGARELFERAGFIIADLKVVGDSYSTSGYIMGFGAGDIDPSYTSNEPARLLQNATDRTSEDPQQWLYIGVALVAQRPQ